MRKFGLFAVLAAAVMASARADVVTNTWITPSGGDWFASAKIVSTNVEGEVEVVTTNVVYTNWQGGRALHLDERRVFPVGVRRDHLGE